MLVKRRYILTLATTVLAIAACGRKQVTSDLPTPATFTGTIPCADCPGIELSLTLRPDSLFYATQIYIEGKDPENSSFTWWGHWSIDTARKRISLISGDHPQYMKVVDSNRIRMLDGDGNEIPTKLNYDLTRAPEIDSLPDTLKSSGLFR